LNALKTTAIYRTETKILVVRETGAVGLGYVGLGYIPEALTRSRASHLHVARVGIVVT
jgi:hypothetical protein